VVSLLTVMVEGALVPLAREATLSSVEAPSATLVELQ